MCCNCNQTANVYFDQISTDCSFSDAFNNKSTSDANVSDIMVLTRFLMFKNTGLSFDDGLTRIVGHLASKESTNLKQVLDWIKRYW